MQNWSSKLKFRSKIGTVHIPPVDIPPVGDPDYYLKFKTFNFIFSKQQHTLQNRIDEKCMCEFMLNEKVPMTKSWKNEKQRRSFRTI